MGKRETRDDIVAQMVMLVILERMGLFVGFCVGFFVGRYAS